MLSKLPLYHSTCRDACDEEQQAVKILHSKACRITHSLSFRYSVLCFSGRVDLGRGRVVFFGWGEAGLFFFVSTSIHISPTTSNYVSRTYS